jgi:hypothetical protein
MKSDYLFLFVNNKKLNVQEFICYMQYEYFILFLINVLQDLQNVADFTFPEFSSQNLKTDFALQILNDQKRQERINFCNYKIIKSKKYLCVLNYGDKYLFICNEKSIKTFKDFFKNEYRYFLVKIMKAIFEIIFLTLHFNDQSQRLKYFSNTNIFYLEAI